LLMVICEKSGLVRPTASAASRPMVLIDVFMIQVLTDA
jgi:hypothetical protein